MFGFLMCVTMAVVGADVRLKASLPYTTAHRFCEITKQPILVVLSQGNGDEAVATLRAAMTAAGVVMVVGEADVAQYRNLWLAVGQPCMPAVVYLYWRDGLRFNNSVYPPAVTAITPDQLRVWLAGRVMGLLPGSRARLGLCPLNLPPPSR